METVAITALLRKLGTMLSDEYKLHRSVKAGVRDLEDMLRSMQAALDKVSALQLAGDGDDAQRNFWARKVRELAYDADDTVDSYLVRVSTKQGAASRPWDAVLQPARRYKARRRIAADIERIRSEVKAASDQLKNFSIPDAGPRCPLAAPVDPRLHLHYENATRLVSMDRSTEALIRLLSPQGDGDNDLKLKVVAIVGAGGIGKTTLAREAYEKLRENFDCAAFVPVSQKPDVKSVLARILRHVSHADGDNHESWGGDDEIIERIRCVLEDKRYIIVIDDIWDESVWKHINCALVQNSRGSKVITTTRKTSIAKLCLSPDSADAIIHELCPLPAVNAQKLFYNKVFGEDSCPSEFRHISEQILARCAGLPLAIVTIAGLLTNKHTMDEWSSIYNSINGVQNPDLEDMRWILSLSYYDLPAELKPCMLYLCLFPEDHKIERDDLIWRWIGEGFVRAKDDKNLYEAGEDYFNELINRSMVQPVHVDDHGRVRACRVHDIVLEFITSLSLQENFVTIYGQHTESPQNKVRRLSLQNSKDIEHTISLPTKSLSNMRSLAIFCHAENLELPLKSFRVLRDLDLEDCSGYNFGDICNLVHLRYLRLSGAHYVEVPKQIVNLQFLQTLDLKQVKIKFLPSTMVQLRQLVRLCVDRNTQLPDGIGNMKSLEELSEIDTSKYPDLMGELGKLHKLRVLEISLGTWDRKHKEPLLNCLCNLTELRTLHIFSRDVSLDFMLGSDWTWNPRHLRGFTVCVHLQTGHIFRLSPSSIWSEFSPFSRLPNWIKPSLSNLCDLAIMVNTLPQQDLYVLGSLTALRSLVLHVVKACARERMEIFGGTNASHVVKFRCLENFNFVSRAAGLVFRQQAMPKLQVLSLSFDVAETKYIHGDYFLGLENLISLKVVDVGIDCRCATHLEVLDAESAIRNSINLNPSHPTLDLHRYFVREMPWDAMIEIPKLEIRKQELAGVAKIGPWGGSRTRPHDISVAPHRLESVTIRSGTVVDSLSFSYYGHVGQRHTAGPWGGCGGTEYKIYLKPSEFVSNISGTVGSYGALRNIVTSLKFITSTTSSYGPYGIVSGEPFDIPVQSNGSIVGFFGHAGMFVDAIGVYVNLGEEKARLTKFGPWGGNGAKSGDVMVAPSRLNSITIRSGTIVDSIKFSYTDHNGRYKTIGPWGGCGGNSNMVKLAPSEFLIGISGSIGPFSGLKEVITSLTFITNARSYGPFGRWHGNAFNFPLQSNGSIVGFFGRYDQYLHAIGIYVNHELEIIEEKEAAVARIGPWGGNRGRVHDIDITVKPHRLESVTIFSGTVIDSLAFLYSDQNGQQQTGGPWGGCGGRDHKIQLDPSEFVASVSGTIGPWAGLPNVVTSLTLVTSTGRRYGPYGQEYGPLFHVPVPRNGRIVGFFAHGKKYIESIGAYVRTL